MTTKPRWLVGGAVREKEVLKKYDGSIPQSITELTLLVYHDDDREQCEYSASFKDAALCIVVLQVFVPCQHVPVDGLEWRGDGPECAALMKRAERALEDHTAAQWVGLADYFADEHEALEALVNILAQCIEGGKTWFMQCSVSGTIE